MQGKYDVAVIGGGVLGTSISYWLSTRYDANVCVIEAESGIAHHASSRNTGVVHSPFYLNPKTSGHMANAMVLSHHMWERLAKKTNTIWSKVGVLEVATNDSQFSTLEKHLKWGLNNGITEKEIKLIESSDVLKLEPNVKCNAAINCPGEVATDFGLLTNALSIESKKSGTQFVFNFNVSDILSDNKINTITSNDGSQIDANFIINCAGGRSLELANMMGHANDYTALHFRGEYWRASEKYRDLVGRSVYSVPQYANYPFLDPHWIVRGDGHVEVGPNAVPVSGPVAYTGSGGISQSITKMCEILSKKSRRLLLDSTFLRMASTEWKSSISKSAMISRIRKFIPLVRPDMFAQRGESGIRTPIVTPQGKITTNTIEIMNDNTCSILNYNSPGATGAPAYSAYIVERLHKGRYLDLKPKNYTDCIWTQSDMDRQD